MPSCNFVDESFMNSSNRNQEPKINEKKESRNVIIKDINLYDWLLFIAKRGGAFTTLSTLLVS